MSRWLALGFILGAGVALAATGVDVPKGQETATPGVYACKHEGTAYTFMFGQMDMIIVNGVTGPLESQAYFVESDLIPGGALTRRNVPGGIELSDGGPHKFICPLVRGAK